LIEACGLSDPGCARSHNEDRILVDKELSLFLVADGMGGHNYGEVAAEMAVAAVRTFIDSSREGPEVTWPFGYDPQRSVDHNRLATAVQLANRRVWERSEQVSELEGMGTTIAAVLVSNDTASVASVGDSRVYLLRDGRLRALTTDDTWVGAMVRQGTLAASEAPHHPMKNVLTQAAGARSSVDVQLLEEKLGDGDLLLLSSDGLHGVVGEERMLGILVDDLGAGRPLAHAAERLIEFARQQEAPDNLSCILLLYRQEAAPG